MAMSTVATMIHAALGLLLIHPLPMALAGSENLTSPDAIKGELDFAGYSLLEALPRSPDDLEVLQALDSTVDEGLLNFWSEPSRLNQTVDVLVHPDLVDPLRTFLEKRGVEFQVKVADFRNVIQAEKASLYKEDDGFEYRDPSGRYPFDFFTYNKLDEINRYLDHLVADTAKYNSLKTLQVTLQTIGKTHEGRDIRMVVVSLQDDGGRKRPAIWMDCGIHAREWVSPAFCLHAVHKLVSLGDQGPLKAFDFYVSPVTNPDGYEYSWTSNRMWRKNRRPVSGGAGRAARAATQLFKAQERKLLADWLGTPRAFPASGASCVGVDPNRNFDIGFGDTSGASSNPCQDTFSGSRPFSEAESVAVKDAVRGIVAKGTNTLAAFVSVHAFSQMWMMPYGYKQGGPAKDLKDLMRVAGASVAALTKVYGTTYKVGPISEIIYVASGSSVDWAYEKANVKYSYALELRDSGQFGFMLPVDQVKPTLDETWEALVAMASALEPEFNGKRRQL